MAEDQSRRSCGASEDSGRGGRRSDTGGGQGPTDIEGPAGGVMSRLQCGLENTTSDGWDHWRNVLEVTLQSPCKLVQPPPA